MMFWPFTFCRWNSTVTRTWTCRISTWWIWTATQPFRTTCWWRRAPTSGHQRNGHFAPSSAVEVRRLHLLNLFILFYSLKAALKIHLKKQPKKNKCREAVLALRLQEEGRQQDGQQELLQQIQLEATSRHQRLQPEALPAPHVRSPSSQRQLETTHTRLTFSSVSLPLQLGDGRVAELQQALRQDGDAGALGQLRPAAGRQQHADHPQQALQWQPAGDPAVLQPSRLPHPVESRPLVPGRRPSDGPLARWGKLQFVGCRVAFCRGVSANQKRLKHCNQNTIEWFPGFDKKTYKSLGL